MRQILHTFLMIMGVLLFGSCTHQDYYIPVDPWDGESPDPGAMIVYPRNGTSTDDVMLRIKDLQSSGNKEVEIQPNRSYDYTIGDYRVTLLTAAAPGLTHSPDFTLTGVVLYETTSQNGECVPELPAMKGFTLDTVVAFNQTTVVNAWQHQLTRKIYMLLNVQGVDISTIKDVAAELRGLYDTKSLATLALSRTSDSVVYAVNHTQTPVSGKIFGVHFNILGVDRSVPQELTVTITTFDGRTLSKTVDISDSFENFNESDDFFLEIDKQISFAIGENGVITCTITDWTPGLDRDIIGD